MVSVLYRYVVTVGASFKNWSIYYAHEQNAKPYILNMVNEYGFYLFKTGRI
jgi:hypothetical protein